MNISKILISRRYLQAEPVEAGTKVEQAYLNAFLFANFGIVVDKPELLTKGHVKAISDEYRLEVPASYFKNPQDMSYYTRDELFIEQVMSYFFAYGADESHVKVFDKQLPEYEVGSDIKLREFKILDADEANVVLCDITKDYCGYKRPWGLDEQVEFVELYNLGYYNNYDVVCGDNAVFMMERDINFARFLYKKDLVKLSIARCGEKKELTLDPDTKELIRKAILLVKDCPMSKKQAKFYNKLVQLTKVRNVKPTTNAQSPNRIATEKLKNGDILGAAEVFAKSGSLLERNLKFLLSRANPVEAVKILDMLSDKNPIVLYQLMSTVMADSEEARTFSFYAKNRVKAHVETEYEARWRKSRLNDATKKLVHDTCLAKIEGHYRALESLGKVYVHPDFYKVAMPVNTSASGRGIDIVPTGTRLPITADNIRTFVHWENAFDIDSSVIVLDKDNNIMTTVNWCNYSNKRFGDALLFSGDNTSRDGTEYYDIRLDAMRRFGASKLIFTFHGFRSTLNEGEIYCGYQQKTDLMTRAWDPKNIELKMHVKGEKRAYVGFAIDFETNEIIVLNLMTDDDSRVVTGRELQVMAQYLDASKLELNMGLIASWRGELVETPEEADIVFADDYVSKVKNLPEAEDGSTREQIVIRSFDVEKLATLVNA